MHDNNPDQNSSSNGATDSNTPPQACVNPKFPLNIGKSNARLRLFSDFCAEDKFAEARLLEAQTQKMKVEAELKSADLKSEKIADALANTMKRLETCKIAYALANTMERLEMGEDILSEDMKNNIWKRIEQLHKMLFGENLKSEKIADALTNTMKRLEKGKMEDALDNTLKRLEMGKDTLSEDMKKVLWKRFEQLENKLLELENEEIRLFFPDW